MVLYFNPIWIAFIVITVVRINSSVASSFPVQIGFDIDGEAAYDGYWSGVALSSDGSIVAIAASRNDGDGGALTDSGHVRVFELSGNSWIQKGGDIDGVASGDHVGIMIDMSHDGTIVAVGGHSYDGPNGVDSGHVRIFEWSGSAWVNLQKGSELVGDAAGDNFGISVALSGDGLTVAAAARYNDGNGVDSGHARVFQWDGSDWAQLGSDIDGEAAGDKLGWDGLALSDDGLILAVGARLNDGNGEDSGHVRVFEWNGSAWVQKGSDIDGAAAGDNFGTKISMSSDGSIFAASAPGSDANGVDSGEVRAFQWNESAWLQMGGSIVGEAAGDELLSVALSEDGTILAVGGYRNDGNGVDSGHARVYQWNGSGWVQVLTAIDGEAAGDQSGANLALSEDGLILAVHGMYNDGANGVDSGHVRVYRLAADPASTDYPVQIGFDIDGEAAYDGYWSGVALSSDGSIVAIAASRNDGDGGTLTDSGHVRVFELSGSSWIQKGGDIDGVASGDHVREIDLSHDGTIVAVGAVNHDGPNGVNSGHVRIFEWSGSAWVQKGSELDGDAAGDGFGGAVALSSDGLIVAISASGSDCNGVDSGSVRVVQWDGSDWAQMGLDIDGEAAGDRISNDGLALSDDGLILVVGSRTNDGNGADSGHVRVFEWNGSAWMQKGSHIDGAAAGDGFGTRISMSSDGSIFAASAVTSDANGVDSGEVRVFQWSGSAWVQMGTAIVGEAAGDSMHDVGLSWDGTILAVGAYGNDGNGVSSGHVRVYQWNGSDWVQVLTDIDGEAAGDLSGGNLALSEDGLILAVHAHYNDGANGVDSGHVRVYRLAAEPPPTSQPTNKPSDSPTSQPTNQPTNKPSQTPTCQPSNQPTNKPSQTPTCQPTNQPSSKPSDSPTSQPTNQPTNKPVKCIYSYRIHTAVCSDHSADDIIEPVDDAGYCRVKVDKVRTCLPVAALTCSNQ